MLHNAAQIPPDPETATVTADVAFDTGKRNDAIAAFGAAPINQPRRDGKLCKPDTAGVIAWDKILRTTKRIGRNVWGRWSG